ncbi:methyltransferase domain-containing protein [Kitasatospora cineracea]|uniref:class I SAM-dependent methyltransferase n=1 Tax=Kitasatospora cineracea TaxID=88074 RepID=UPI0034073F63
MTIQLDTAVANAQLDDLVDFYLPQSADEPSLFEIWERGEARGDSVTPSTFSPEYRSWMRDLLVGELRRQEDPALLSLGSGNAAVESDVQRQGYRVLAVDAMAEAVAIARGKGLEAVRADITTWTPEGRWPVVYMDGLLGHLLVDGQLPVLARIHGWLAAGGHGTLVASNDSTRNGEGVQKAPGVTGFHWLSEEYLREQALAAGFTDVRVETFHYSRPLSGDRARSVIVARV